MSNTNTEMPSSSDRLLGCVKWFDNELNYGFVTVISPGEHYQKDIFAHQTNIKTSSEDTYRTLYSGECIEFTLTSTTNDKHPYHATEITAFQGNKLQCESGVHRRDSRRRFNGQGGNSSYRGRGRGGRGRGGHPGRQNRRDNAEQPVEEN